MALKRRRKEEVKTQSLGMGFVFGGLVGWILVWMECGGERQAPIGNGRGVGHTNQGLLGGRLVLFFPSLLLARSRLARRGLGTSLVHLSSFPSVWPLSQDPVAP